jgi:hypothetical protein
VAPEDAIIPPDLTIWSKRKKNNPAGKPADAEPKPQEQGEGIEPGQILPEVGKPQRDSAP